MPSSLKWIAPSVTGITRMVAATAADKHEWVFKFALSQNSLRSLQFLVDFIARKCTETFDGSAEIGFPWQ
jgi:hypothetical protein